MQYAFNGNQIIQPNSNKVGSLITSTGFNSQTGAIGKLPSAKAMMVSQAPEISMATN